MLNGQTVDVKEGGNVGNDQETCSEIDGCRDENGQFEKENPIRFCEYLFGSQKQERNVLDWIKGASPERAFGNVSENRRRDTEASRESGSKNVPVTKGSRSAEH